MENKTYNIQNPNLKEMPERQSENCMLRKLKSRSGESIAETLVAVLIAALALMMLAGAINASSNMITKSKNLLNTYYTANNNLASETSAGSDLEATVTISTLSQARTVTSYSPDYATGDSKLGGAEDLISYKRK